MSTHQRQPRKQKPLSQLTPCAATLKQLMCGDPTEALALLAFIESLPADDPVRVFLAHWRAHRDAHGAVCGDGDPFHWE